MARKAAAQTEDGPQKIEEPPAPLIGDVEVDVTEDTGAVTEPVVVETAPEPDKPAEDPDKVAMQRRLAEVEAAAEAARQEANTVKLQLKQSQVEQELKGWQAKRQVFNSTYESLTNALGAVQTQIDAQKQELRSAQRAVNEGNMDASDLVADLQVQLGELGSQKRELERKKEWADNEDVKWRAWEERVRAQPQRQQPQQPQQRQQPQQPQTVEQIIAQSGLPARAQTWLREHPDFITDADKNAKMQKMHYVAEHHSGEVFSDAYFEQMESLLGVKSNSQQPQRSQTRSAPVSAPPTREAPSMATGRAPQTTRVTLDKEEREVAAQIAASRGVSQKEAEQIYAENKIKIQKAKANGSMS